MEVLIVEAIPEQTGDPPDANIAIELFWVLTNVCVDCGRCLIALVPAETKV
jgi:hypothetical protein